MRLRLEIVVLLLLAGCATGAARPEIRVRHLPPTKADVIEAAIRMSEEPLEGHDWCDGLVNDTEPPTLERYLAPQGIAGRKMVAGQCHVRGRGWWRVSVGLRHLLHGPRH
jgi:hypothetical protein